MTNKNLARRLERLEARLLRATEEPVLILSFITADGEIVSTKEFRRTVDRRPIKRNKRWQRAQFRVKKTAIRARIALRRESLDKPVYRS